MTTDTGYCTECHMIVDTGPDGTSKRHGSRGMVDNRGAWTGSCDGSFAPASPIPETAEVEAARFTAEPRKARCRVCRSEDGGSGERLYSRSDLDPFSSDSMPLCPECES